MTYISVAGTNTDQLIGLKKEKSTVIETSRSKDNVIEYKDKFGQNKQESGYVTLIR